MLNDYSYANLFIKIQLKNYKITQACLIYEMI